MCLVLIKLPRRHAGRSGPHGTSQWPGSAKAIGKASQDKQHIMVQTNLRKKSNTESRTQRQSRWEEWEEGEHLQNDGDVSEPYIIIVMGQL